jgi:retron-type reverse transcriptase
MDIEKFFDTVDYKWLTRDLEQRIKDPHLLRLTGRLLNTRVVEEGKYIPPGERNPSRGSPKPDISKHIPSLHLRPLV